MPYDNEYNRDIARKTRSIVLNYINSDLVGGGSCNCDGESNYKKGGARLGNPKLIGYPKGTYLSGSQMPSGAYGTNAYGTLGRGISPPTSLINDTLLRQNTDIIGANSAGRSRMLSQKYNGAGVGGIGGQVVPSIRGTSIYDRAIRHQVYDSNRPPSNLTPVAQQQGQYGSGRYSGDGFLEDFGTGFKRGFFGTLGLAQPLLPLLGVKGAIASAGIEGLKKLAGGKKPERPNYGLDLEKPMSGGSYLQLENSTSKLIKPQSGSGRSAGSKLNTGGRPRLSKAKKAEKKALEKCMNRKSGAGFKEEFIRGFKMPYEYAYNKVLKPVYTNVIEPSMPAIKEALLRKLREKAQEAIVAGIQGLGRSAGSKLNTGGRPRLSKAKKAEKKALEKCMMGAGRSAGSKLNTGGRPRLSKAKKAEKKALEKCMSGKGKGNRTEIVRGVMNDMGLSMIEASKYVKAHNLY